MSGGGIPTEPEFCTSRGLVKLCKFDELLCSVD